MRCTRTKNPSSTSTVGTENPNRFGYGGQARKERDDQVTPCRRCRLARWLVRTGASMVPRSRCLDASVTHLPHLSTHGKPHPIPRYRSCASPMGTPAICSDCSRVTNLLNRSGVPCGVDRAEPLAFVRRFQVRPGPLEGRGPGWDGRFERDSVAGPPLKTGIRLKRREALRRSVASGLSAS